jgi:hypothetical protein
VQDGQMYIVFQKKELAGVSTHIYLLRGLASACIYSCPLGPTVIRYPSGAGLGPTGCPSIVRPAAFTCQSQFSILY